MRSTLTILAFVLAAFSCAGQSYNYTSTTEHLFQYLDIRASSTDVTQTADLIARVEKSDLPAQGRVAAFQQLIFKIATLLKNDTTGLNTYLVSTANRIIKDNIHVFEDLTYTSTPLNELAEVKKIGSGKTPVILIPEFRKNWLIYKKFMETHGDEYTFYAITLPGYNGTAPYPLPSTYDFSKRVWLNSVVRGLATLIQKNNLQKPIIAGTLNAGIYIAVTLATQHPDLVGGILSFNGALFETLEPTPLSVKDRERIINIDLGTILGHLFFRKKMSEQEIDARLAKPLKPNHPINHYTLDTVFVKQVLKMHVSFPSITERYNEEWQTADLTSSVEQLKVPMVILGAKYDDAWPFAPNDVPGQWERFMKSHPKSTVTYVTEGPSRLLMVVDEPEEIAKHLRELVGGAHNR